MATAEAPVCTKGPCLGAEPAVSTKLLQRCGTALAAGPRHIWDSGLTCSFLASFIFSFSALFVKLTAGRVPVLEVCLVRSSISAGLSFILMYVSGLDWRLWFGKRAHLKMLFLRGCCGACSMTTYYVALFMLPLGDAVTMKLIGPPVSAVLARLLLKEPFGYHGGAGCLISLLGVVLVARPPFLFGGAGQEWARARSIGIAAGVLSAVLSGCSSMTVRLIGGSEPAAVIALWFHCATMLLSVIPLAAGFPNKAVLLSRADGSLMLGVACTSFVSQLFSTRGLQRCQAAKATAMGFTQVVYSHIMGAIFFHDKLTMGSFLGTLLIVVGVLLVTLRSAKPSTSTAAMNTAACSCVAVAHGTVADSECKESADDTAALLSDDHVPSHIAAGTHANEDVAAVAVIKLRDDISTLSAKDDPASLPCAEGEQAQLLSASMAAVGDHIEPATELGLLAHIAASADAALGGELCPAASAAVALDLPRQVSRQLASLGPSTVSRLSRQPSQDLFGSLSAFMTAPGIPGLSAVPWDWQGLELTLPQQQPAARQQQPQEGTASEDQHEQRGKSQASATEVQAGGSSPEGNSAPNSPGRRTPARLEQHIEQDQGQGLAELHCMSSARRGHCQ